MPLVDGFDDTSILSIGHLGIVAGAYDFRHFGLSLSAGKRFFADFAVSRYWKTSPPRVPRRWTPKRFYPRAVLAPSIVKTGIIWPPVRLDAVCHNAGMPR